MTRWDASRLAESQIKKGVASYQALAEKFEVIFVHLATVAPEMLPVSPYAEDFVTGTNTEGQGAQNDQVLHRVRLEVWDDASEIVFRARNTFRETTNQCPRNRG